MSESIVTIEGTKEEKYQNILPQIKAIITGEPDLIANMANISAALMEQFKWWWVGFYIVRADQLVLGPFQGPIACTRIAHGKGVCGSAWKEARTIIVDDVNQFAGHIACSAASNSEIVVPLIKNNQVIGVLDIDSEHIGYFDKTDQKHLEQLITILSEI